MADHRKLSHTEFKSLLEEIIAKANTAPADFGLTADVMTAVGNSRAGMNTKIADNISKKDAAKASTSALNAERKSGDELVSELKAMMRLAKMPSEKFLEIGLDADDVVQTPSAPQTPLDLLVEGFSNGNNNLKFNRNGNKQNTIFNVEAKIGGAADFVIVGSTTKTTWVHKNQTPGVKVVYRVRAQRGDDYSDYSNPATVYE